MRCDVIRGRGGPQQNFEGGWAQECSCEMNVEKDEQKVIVKSVALEKDREKITAALEKSFVVEEDWGEGRGPFVCAVWLSSDGWYHPGGLSMVPSYFIRMVGMGLYCCQAGCI